MVATNYVKRLDMGLLVTSSGDVSGETDSASIEAAMQVIAANKGGHIYLGKDLWIKSPIQLRAGVQLHGPGWEYPVKLANGANSSMLVATDQDSWFRASNIHFDGRKENQTAGTAAVEIMTKFGRATRPVEPPASCSWPGLYDIMVSYAYGDSFHLEGVETRAEDCFSFRPGGHGYVLDQTDQFLRTCTSGESAGDGFLLNGSEHQLIHCKAWWSGWQTGRGTYVGKGATDLKGPTSVDFRVRGGSHQLTAIHAQDGAKAGISVEGSHNNITGRVGRAGHEGTIDGTLLTLNGSAHRNTINVTQDDATGNPYGTSTKYMVSVNASAVGNNIRIAGDVSSTGLATRFGADSLGGEKNGRNRVVLGREGIVNPVSYATTITPSPISGGLSVTLTGDTTIANPAADHSCYGMEMEVALTQDATGGRAVTWGSNFAGMSAIDAGANKTSRWVVRCVGAKWIQKEFISY